MGHQILQAERMKALRVGHSMTKKQVADYLKIGSKTYAQYENGTANCPIKRFLKLAQLYGVSMNYLLGMTNDPCRYQ